jgi:hypothetical protein
LSVWVVFVQTIFLQGHQGAEGKKNTVPVFDNKNGVGVHGELHHFDVASREEKLMQLNVLSFGLCTELRYERWLLANPIPRPDMTSH